VPLDLACPAACFGIGGKGQLYLRVWSGYMHMPCTAYACTPNIPQVRVRGTRGVFLTLGHPRGGVLGHNLLRRVGRRRLQRLHRHVDRGGVRPWRAGFKRLIPYILRMAIAALRYGTLGGVNLGGQALLGGPAFLLPVKGAEGASATGSACRTIGGRV